MAWTVDEAAALQNRAVSAPAIGQQILLAVLFLSVLSSSFVFIQPAPYEGFMAVLALCCLIGGVKFDRQIVPLLILTLILDVSGLAATTFVLDQPDVIGFFGITIYLGLTGVMFACFFTQDSLRRVNAVRAAYILSAIPAVIIGLLAYFQALPYTDLFLMDNRVSSTFKDPNVYGPFLVPPLLFLIQGLVARGFKPLQFILAMLLFAGLLFSFSRGAWGNFVFAVIVMLWLLFVTAQSGRSRIRILALGLIALVGVAMLGLALLSIEGVRDTFLQRASLLQDYDVGPAGRFGVQERSLDKILENPFGMGALEFARINVIPPHNIYLWITVSYGWLAGIAYLGSVLLTLVQGFRAALVHTPWQPQLCVVYAAYVGLAAEGFIIDTDHWRHYYVLLGLVWGLVAATKNYARGASSLQHRTPSPFGLQPA